MSNSPGEPNEALGEALKLLNRRAFSRGEMLTRLARLGYSEASREEAVSRLDDLRLLNDVELASRLAEASKGRKFGRRRAELDMRQRGIPEDLARDAAEAVFSDVDEEVLAVEWGQRKDRQVQSKDLPHRKASVARFLARKGFASGSIQKALEALYG